MAISLRPLVSEPKDKWFYLSAAGGKLKILPTEEGADLSLLLKFRSQRDLRQLITNAVTAATERKTVSKKGMKALVSDDSAAHRAICQETVLNWKMNVLAAFALNAECDFSHAKPSEEIVFSDENLEVMVVHSNLAAIVNNFIEDHGSWYEVGEVEGEGEKNSVSGQSTSSDRSVAEAASTPT